MTDDKKNNVHSAILVKRNGKLSFKSNASKTLYKMFEAQLVDEGQEVELFYSALSNKASLAMLAKVAIVCRKLAEEIGTDVEDIILQAKRKSGFVVGTTIKSRGEMSSAELSTMLETLYGMGDFVGCNLRG